VRDEVGVEELHHRRIFEVGVLDEADRPMPAAPISRMKRYCVPGMGSPERYWGLLELI